MKKQELIEKLQALPDDINVILFDHRMNLNIGGGEPESAGCYSDFDISLMHHDLSEDEKEYYRERHDFVPKPVIVISFDNPDYEQ